MFDYIFVDLDGPILDGKLRHYNCYVDIIKKYGGAPLDIETYWRDKRNKVKRDILLQESKFAGSYDDFLDEWIHNIESPDYLRYDVLKPQVSETLQLWAEQSTKKLVLATMRQNRANLIMQLTQLNVLHLFDEVIDCPPFSANPKYSKLKDFRFTQALFIGDTEEDVDTAHKLGIPIVGVLNGLRSREHLHADFFVNEIAELNFVALNLTKWYQ